MVDEKLLYVTAALVQFLKNFGVNGNASMVASVIIGALLAAGQTYAPEFMNDVLPILITGLTASGLYDIGKAAGRGVLKRLNNN